MATFSSLELTGRTRSHIVEVSEPRVGLHRDVVLPFLAMRAAAADSGIDMEPVSGFRDFARQQAIWNGKYRGERPLLDRHGRPLNAADLPPGELVPAILLWSALPGASRHHWGTDIDVIDRAALGTGQRAHLLGTEYAPGGAFARLDSWLAQHGGHFGFYRPYDCDRGGVQPEPWHVSFAPLAQVALTELRFEVLAQSVASDDLAGREAVQAMLPQIYERFVCAVASPTAAALAAAGLSRSTTPS